MYSVGSGLIEVSLAGSTACIKAESKHSLNVFFILLQHKRRHSLQHLQQVMFKVVIAATLLASVVHAEELYAGLSPQLVCAQIQKAISNASAVYYPGKSTSCLFTQRADALAQVQVTMQVIMNIGCSPAVSSQSAL
jgi:hypothetical protein